MSILELLLADAQPGTLERIADELRRGLNEENTRADIRLNMAKQSRALAAKRRAIQPTEKQLMILYRQQRDMEILRLARRGWSGAEIAARVSENFPKAPITSPATVSRIITARIGRKDRRKHGQDSQIPT